MGQAILRQLEDGWNARDAAACAAPFAEDADYVGIRGNYYHGRWVIEDLYRQLFDRTPAAMRISYELTHARRLAEGVFLVHGTGTIRVPSGPLKGSESAAATLVIVRATGGWKIAAFQHTGVVGEGSA